VLVQTALCAVVLAWLIVAAVLAEVLQ